MRLRNITLAAVAVTVGCSFAVPSLASAAAPAPQVDKAEVCERLADVRDRLNNGADRVRNLIATLESRLAAAQEAGNEEAAARLTNRLERIKQIAGRLAQRLDRVESRLSEHCA